MTTVNGQYAMAEWNETPLIAQEPPQKSARVEAWGKIEGALKGDAKTFYILSYITSDTGVFTGFTHFNGKLGAREGGFVLIDNGTFDAKSATSKWTIVEGSGRGDFKGIKGSGGFKANHGLTFDFELELEEVPHA